MGQQQQGDILFRKEITEVRLNPISPVSIPGHALALLPPFGAESLSIEVEASDINGAVHCFKFIKRLKGQYPKPTIPESCWKKIVDGKGLILGDRITLYRILNKATRRYEYEVRCERLWNHLKGPHWLNVEMFDN